MITTNMFFVIPVTVLKPFNYDKFCISVRCPPGSFSLKNDLGCIFLQYLPKTKLINGNQISSTKDHCDLIGSNIPVVKTPEQATEMLTKINSLLV